MRRSVTPIVGSLASTTRIGRRRWGRRPVPIRCRRSTRRIECSAIRPAERSTTRVSGRRRRHRRRRRHDSRSRRTRHRTYDAPMHPSHLGPARIPWRSLLVVGIDRGGRCRRAGAVHRTRRAGRAPTAFSAWAVVSPSRPTGSPARSSARGDAERRPGGRRRSSRSTQRAPAAPSRIRIDRAWGSPASLPDPDAAPAGHVA